MHARETLDCVCVFQGQRKSSIFEKIRLTWGDEFKLNTTRNIVKRKTINKMSVSSGSGRYSVVNGKLIFFSTTQTYDSDLLYIYWLFAKAKQSWPSKTYRSSLGL